MAAYDTGKMILFVRSILWDLGIPQEAATVLYEDNNACTAMGNAQKPTPRTRHIDIKYFSICEWIECDLMILERIDTTINMSDHFTKGLSRALFHRHADYLLGGYSMLYRPQKIYSYMARMCLMLLQRLPPPNRDFIYTLTGRSGSGGATTRNGLQLPTGMLSLSYPQCRAIRNPPGYGRNMLTPSCVSVASRLRSMNHVFTPAWSMVSE